MENFVYETPTKVYFGKEEELNVGKIIAGYAPKKVLVHFGGQSARKSGLLDRVEKALEAEGIAYLPLDELLQKNICVCTCLNKFVTLLHQEEFEKFGNHKRCCIAIIHFDFGSCSCKNFPQIVGYFLETNLLGKDGFF